MNRPPIPIRFGIPLEYEHTMVEFPVANNEVYMRHYAMITVDVGTTHPEVHEYVAWCFRDRWGEEYGPLRTMDIPFTMEGQLDPQCPSGEVVDSEIISLEHDKWIHSSR